MEYGLALVWLAAYLWLLVAGLPLAAALCPRLPDRGAGLALPLSTAILAFVAYWVGHLAFGWPALVAGLAVVVAGSVLAYRRGVDVDWRRYRDVAVVFAVAFAFLVAVRAVDPAAWAGGGEKFLDFGLLASLLRADVLPPEDVWFAGEPVRYYYGGHLVAALLARLTFTPASHAYNLALAGFYATFVSTAFGLAGTIAAASGRSYRLGGGAAAFLVALASNLSSPLRLAIWALPDGLGRWLAGLAGMPLQGLTEGPGQFNYWFASRVIPGTINEFPFFAFLNGDLHAHMMGPPFLLLAVGLLFSYHLTPAVERRRRLLLLAAVGPLAGLLAVVNTWSLPTVLGLAWLTLTFAPASPATLVPGTPGECLRDLLDGGRREEVGRPLLAGVFVAYLAVLAVLSVAPFFTGTARGQGIGLLPERSGLGGLLLVHGAFLLVSWAYLLARPGGRRWGPPAAIAGVGLLALAAVAGVTLAGVALFVPLLAVGWYLLRRDAVGYETVLVVGVAGLVLLVEFVFLREEAGPGRMNTVFKVYAQVWALWAVAAGAMLADLLAGDPGPAPTTPRAARSVADGGADGAPAAGTVGSRLDETAADTAVIRPGSRTLRVGVAAVLLLSLSVYPALAIGQQFTDEGVAPSLDEPTLDARSYVTDYHPREAAAIAWLADLEGQPNMASAPGRDIYQWVNAPSSLTGIPTVAGWAHEVGYRGPEAYYERADDVDRLFTGDPATRATLIERYDVAYVYVGPIERERYGDADLTFDDEPGIEVAYRDDHVTIYAVDRSALVEG